MIISNWYIMESVDIGKLLADNFTYINENYERKLSNVKEEICASCNNKWFGV